MYEYVRNTQSLGLATVNNIPDLDVDLVIWHCLVLVYLIKGDFLTMWTSLTGALTKVVGDDDRTGVSQLISSSSKMVLDEPELDDGEWEDEQEDENQR